MPWSVEKQGEPFWGKVDKSGECWLWTGKRDRNGYGQCVTINRITGKPTTTTAHRFAYEQTIGPVPDGLVVDHLCKNRACVNPAHLEAITQRENLMRSPTLQAANAQKTHCLRGHEFTETNTLVIKMPNGRTRRNCRACRAFAASGR